MNRRSLTFPAALAAALLLGCGDDGGGTAEPEPTPDVGEPDAGGDAGEPEDAAGEPDAGAGEPDAAPEPEPVAVPETYTFESVTMPGTSSVAYAGQAMRQVLMHDLKKWIGGLTERIDGVEAFQPADGDVVAALDFYYRFDAASNAGEPHAVSTDPAPLQETYEDFGATADLVSKTAGNDAATDHADWKTAFAGWSDAGIAAHGGDVSSPEGLLVAFFETLEQAAIDRANGIVPAGIDGEVLPVTVTESGLELGELIQKFLSVAVSFSQGTDDYLDDDVAGKGLLATNVPAEGKAYSELEHAWDEAFGYFGAARNYGHFTDDDIAGKGTDPAFGKGWNDADGDGAIDLTSELIWGHAQNAGKRDRESVAPTDLSGDAFGAFLAGRALLRSAVGRELTEAELSELKGHRDAVVKAWEEAIAATCVHYVNETLVTMAKWPDGGYSHAAHAKGWSELKGFALGFQFNPRSPLSKADFAELHALLGDAPVLPDADPAAVEAYRVDLLAARDLLGNAFGFDPANLGDDTGAGGW